MKGMVIPTVGWLVIAVAAIILLTILFSMLVPAIGDFVGAAIVGLKREFCRSILDCWRDPEVPPWCWVFCSGL
jgi:hypothetical protein